MQQQYPSAVHAGFSPGLPAALTQGAAPRVRNTLYKIQEGLINSSFRVKRSADPESRCLYSICFWIPAYAGMTKDELIRSPFNNQSLLNTRQGQENILAVYVSFRVLPWIPWP
jgi:hypothetical protein